MQGEGSEGSGAYMVRTKDPRGTLAVRVGMLVPMEARGALSWYANQFKRCFPGDALTILTEENETSARNADCVPCWDRHTRDFSRLNQVLVNRNIDVLHIVAFRPFFSAQAFLPFLATLKSRGVRVVLDIRDAKNVDPNLLSIMRAADRVIVPDEQSALEYAAQGVTHSNIELIEQGTLQAVPVLTASDARTSLGIPGNEPVVLTITDGLPSEALDRFAAAVQSARSGQQPIRLLIAAIEPVQDGSGFDYRRERIAELRRRFAAEPWVIVPERWFGCEDLPRLVASADVVAFSGSEPAFETSQALALAFHMRRPAAGPARAPFLGHAERMMYIDQGFSPASAVAALVSNGDLRRTLEEAGAAWAAENSFDDYVSALAQLYTELKDERPGTPTFSAPLVSNIKVESVRAAVHRLPRILMQCRENAYTQPGGDTVLMDGISAGLRARGLVVDIDVRGEKNPRDYDLVHLWNFALKEQLERAVKRCTQLSVPFVVNTLYEDWPLFQNQMLAHCAALEAYINSGQDKARWPELLRTAKNVRPAPIWDNSLAANNAAALLASGTSEIAALRRDYPAAKVIEVCPVAADFLDFRDGGDLFRKETGLKDFVLCVGRFELRKNQLMLLKALEDSDMTVVFAGGGFSYQPSYADACRRFKRKGNTVFLDRLEPKMLASAFQAARVHALPGWLELPGIVSLEAANLGTNVVVSDFGTPRDYLGDDAFYCHPGEPDSIRNAVEAAFHSPTKAGLRERVAKFTWDRTAISVGETYQLVLASRGDYDWSFLREDRIPPAKPETNAEQSLLSASAEARAAGRSVGLIPVMVGEASDGPGRNGEAKRHCEEGDRLAKAGDIAGAKRSYQSAIEVAPNFGRGYRSCGAVALSTQSFADAEKFFDKALELDRDDSRSMIGLGSIRWEQEKKDEAFNLFLKAARLEPSNGLAILHLVRTAYALDRLKELEHALRAFLKSDPDNINVLYCLAGCSYRRGRLSLASGVVERMLKIDPSHADAIELKEKIRESQRARSNAPAPKSADLDEKLREIEIEKRNRNTDAVLRGAEEILSNAAAQPRQKTLATVFKAEMLGMTGKLAEADSLFAQIENDPAVAARALAGRGAVLAAGNNFKLAKDYFERALKIQPEYDVALAGMGLVETQDSRPEVAWSFFQRALKANPENLRALYGVIQLGYPLKRLDEMAAALETYLDLRPVDLAINYSYAGCCYALGQKDKARAELQKILLFDAQHRLAKELLDKIEAEERQKVAHAG